MIVSTWDPVNISPSASLTNGGRDLLPTINQGAGRILQPLDASRGLVVCGEYIVVAPDSAFGFFPGPGIVPASDAFNSDGVIGIANGFNGSGAYDSGTGTDPVFHAGVTSHPPHGPNIGGALAGGEHRRIFWKWNQAAGTVSLYRVTDASGPVISTLYLTLTGIPTSGMWMPAYGCGGTGGNSQQIRWNGGADPFMDPSLAAGCVTYDEAVSPAVRSAQLLNTF